MTYSTKNEVVIALVNAGLPTKCNFTLKTTKSVFMHFEAKLVTWEIHLIPLNGYMNNIKFILSAVRKIDKDICVFVTTLEGGCLLLY